MKASFLPGFPRPLVFAHRGLSSLKPENSMAAFKAAWDAGIPGIELDIHRSKDAKLVVFHDDTTTRIVPETKAPGREKGFSIEGSEYAFLSSLDIGSWMDLSYASERMPLLDDVLEELGRDIYFDIEIKCRSIGDTGLESLLADTLRRHEMQGRCIVSSFNPLSLRRCAKYLPEFPTAIIWSRSEELYWYLRRGEGRWIGAADILKPECTLVARRRVFHSLRRPLLPWTVDKLEDEARVLAAGAEGIISNFPQSLSTWNRKKP